ncbi:MAG: DUF1697 domain-containing protein, partial [Bacteroidetes bacterium]|nr:DUF1697 domain-containing protein [Bacteroidota bacterium]
YDFDVPTLVKTAEEGKEIISGNPFLKDPSKDNERQYVTLLFNEPQISNVKQLQTMNFDPEQWHYSGKNIYLYLPNGYGRAKLNNNYFEAKFKVSATTRNWKTVNALAEMAARP